MKQLKTFTGGHPFNLDDLIHVQDGVKESIISMMKGLVSSGASVPNCILYGVVFTQYGVSSVFDISAGAIVLDGEICLFDGIIAVDLDAYPNKYVFSPLDTYPANNPVIYANATPRNVHLIRKAQMLGIPIANTPAVNQAEMNIKRFTDILKDNLFPSANSAWRYVGNAGQPPLLNGFTVGFPGNTPQQCLRFCKLINGDVRINSYLDFNGVSTVASLANITYLNPLVIFTLPGGFRPDSAEAFSTVSVETPDGWCSFKIRVKANGNVELMQAYNYTVGVVTPSSFAGSLAIGFIDLSFRAL